jgi:hypothetical protein
VKRTFRIALFAALSAAATALGGWWTVPLLAALWVRVLPSDRRGPATTVVGAAAGWLALLGVEALHGPIPALATLLSAVLGLPRAGFLLATVLFPAALAGSAAILAKPSSSA